ncbi:MAG: beta strand repeat-containing protein [Verrucomicrobiota bacterium]
MTGLIPSLNSRHPLQRTCRPILLALAMMAIAHSASAQTTYVWTHEAGGDASGSWAAGANWTPVGPANGSGNAADFSTVATANDAVITLDGNQTIGSLLFGGANNWSFNPGTGGGLILAVNSGSPTITVTNNSAIFNVSLSGANGLSLFGADGKYTILTATNSYSGDTVLNAGASLGIGSDLALGTGRLIAGATAGANQTFVMAAGGDHTVTNDIEIRSLRLVVRNNTAAGFVPGVLTLNGNVLINNGSSNVRDFYNDGAVTINGIISGGPVGLIKNGGGTLTLTGNNVYTNGTTVSGGTLSISQDGNLGAAGAPLTISGGALRITGTALNDLSSRTVNWSTFGSGSASGLDIADANNTFSVTSPISSGSGVWFNKWGAGTLLSAANGTGEIAGYTAIRNGTLLITNGTWGCGLETMPGYGSGSVASVIVGNAGVLDSYVLRVGDTGANGTFLLQTGGTIRTDEASTKSGGTGYLIFNGGKLAVSTRNAARAPANWIHDISYAYVSTNGGIIDVADYKMTIPQDFQTDPNLGGAPDGGLVKLGNGTLTLSGSGHSYVGATIVSNGTLAVDGYLGFSPVTVLSGATLAGVGTIVNSVSVQTGGTLAGTPSLSGSATVGNGGTVNPAGGTFGTITVGDLNCSAGSTLWFDLNTYNSEGGGANDEVVVNGTLTISGTTTVYINPASGPLQSSSRYVVLRYYGGLSGNVNNLVIGGPLAGSRQSLTLDTSVPGEIAVVTGTDSALTLTWVGDGSANLWNVAGTSNWVDATFSANNFYNGDSVTFDDSGSFVAPIQLVGVLKPFSVTVNAVDSYTFAGTGRLSGTASLTKNNSGTLVIATDSDQSGSITLSGGSIQVGNGAGTGSLGSGTVSVTAAGTTLAFNRTNSLTVANTIANGGGNPNLVVNSGSVTLTGTGDNSGAGATVNAGTLVLAKTSSSSVHALGSSPTTVNAGATLQLGGSGGDQIFLGATITNNGTFDLAGQSEGFNALAGNGLVTSSVASNVVLTLGQNNGGSTFSGSIQNGSGTLALVKAGTGTQVLTGTNSYGGGTTLSAGVLAVTNDAALGAVPAVPSTNVVFTAASTLRFLGSTTIGANRMFNLNTGNASFDVQTNTVTIAGQIKGGGALVKPNSAGTLILTASNSYAGTTTISDTAGGAASVLRIAHSKALSSGAIGIGGGGNSDQSRLELTGGITLANTLNTWASRNTASPNIVNISDVNTINSAISGGGGGGQSTLRSDAGKLVMLGAISTRQLNLQGAGDGELRGVVTLQSGYHLVKNGTGTWTLSATNNYTGMTTNNDGTLIVNGVVPTNVVTIVGGTLAGTGTVRGATTVQANGTLAPGVNGIGTLSISNTLTLLGTNIMEIARNGSTITNDQVKGVGTLNLGGTLVVNNIGGSPLQVGDSFKLFSAATYVGNFASVILPANATWTNKTAIDGTIAVLTVSSSVSTNPTNITAQVVGGSLQLSWPADHLGWELQAQTNALDVGLTTNWVTVPGSTVTNQGTLPLSAANPAVFYRLHYQY